MDQNNFSDFIIFLATKIDLNRILSRYIPLNFGKATEFKIEKK